MEIYLINLLIVTIGSLLAEKTHKKKRYIFNTKLNWYFLSFVMISLICVSGFRYKVGTDFTTYSEIYIYSGANPISWLEPELGFDILYKSLYKITTNPQFFFFVTSVLINIGIVSFLKRNSESFSLSMYLYITTFIYYGTMNGLRQYLASMILIAGYRYIVNGNFKKYFIYILVASLFHTSAFIMIPIFFVVRKDICSFTNKIILVIFAFAFIFYQQFLNVIFAIFGESKYGYYEQMLADTSNGANILRIAVWMLPIIVILLFRKKEIKPIDKELTIILNLCIIGTLFMILAYRHVFFARFCMYFDIYYLLLLPKLCNMFDEKTNRIIKYGVIVGYFAYSTLLLLSGEGWIYPYKYNLNLF